MEEQVRWLMRILIILRMGKMIGGGGKMMFETKRQIIRGGSLVRFHNKEEISNRRYSRRRKLAWVGRLKKAIKDLKKTKLLRMYFSHQEKILLKAITN